MKDILVYLLTNIVDTPDEVSVDESEADGVTTFTIHVATTDMGKVIGKEGKIIRSIRNILKVKAMKEEKRIYVTLAE
jgi:predicted RNA-binding protein YlqC (UPF0109 family)